MIFHCYVSSPEGNLFFLIFCCTSFLHEAFPETTSASNCAILCLCGPLVAVSRVPPSPPDDPWPFQEPKIAGTYTIYIHIYHVRAKFQGIYAPKSMPGNLVELFHFRILEFQLILSHWKAHLFDCLHRSGALGLTTKVAPKKG